MRRVIAAVSLLLLLYVVGYGAARGSGRLLYLGSTLALRPYPPGGCVAVGKGRVQVNERRGGLTPFLIADLFAPCSFAEERIRDVLHAYPKTELAVGG